MKKGEIKKKSKMLFLSSWKRYLPIIFENKKSISIVAFVMIIASAIDVLVPLFSAFAVDRFIEPKQLEGIEIFALVGILLMVVQSTCTILLAKHAIGVEMNIARGLKEKMFIHLQKLSLDYYNATPVGTIVARVMSDTEKIASIIAWGIVDIVWASAAILGYIITMLMLNVELAVLVLSIVPCIMVVTYFFQRKIFHINKEIRSTNAEITREFNEGIAGAKTTKTLVIEEKKYEQFKKITSLMKGKSIQGVTLNAIYLPLIATLTSLAVAMIISIGGNLVFSETIALWELTAFINYALVIAGPVQQLTKTISNMVATQVNIERCNTLLDLEPMVKDSDEVVRKYGTVFAPKVENWEPLKGNISFEEVTFMYADGTDNVLEKFNLEIKAGTTVAIVGETGAGKSTLVNLACRFFEPTEGRILIDGIDYKERSLSWLHSNIGYVLQTPHLFSGTIKDNIRYGKLDATDEEIIQAAKMVSVHKVIMSMEKGYDSEVGEGGDQLSTGQKQLISFARAILSNPKIFVLDEATASIDTKTEELIQEAISTLLGSRTSFLIAHRLSTIRKADIILVVKEGKIIEQGTHQELLAQKGYYANLYNQQFENEVTSRIFDET